MYVLGLMKHCDNNTYFTFDGQRYSKVKGILMDSPLLPVVVSLFMEDLHCTSVTLHMAKI